MGRYGSFKYNNQDHSILMGLLAAGNILKNAGNDLWSVNSDYENYQSQLNAAARLVKPPSRLNPRIQTCSGKIFFRTLARRFGLFKGGCPELTGTKMSSTPRGMV